MASKSIVCWLWGDQASRDYRPEHVNVLRRMFARCLPEPHRFICITDETEGFDPEVELMPTPPAALAVGRHRNPEGRQFPMGCYRRLWMFSADARCLGERVMLVDVDMVLTGDVSHLFDTPGELVGWKPRASWGHAHDRIGGGVYVLTTGTQRHVWDSFDGSNAIAAARRAGYRGSDQAWMSYQLRGCPVLPAESGIYSIRDLDDGRQPLPADACLVQFNGTGKPWHSDLEWVKEHWR